jgi:serine/threonine-protein kinase HipA
MGAGRSLPGVQQKVALKLSSDTDRPTLFVTLEGSEYILKPASDTYPSLPENEHVTTRLALLVGISTPPCGLIKLRDDSLAFLSRRFDRPARGGKLPVEDFCQLNRLWSKENYDGSAELCARTLRRHCPSELPALYRRILFAWWVADGDLHLKNLSLLGDGRGGYGLSPAYDMLASEHYFARDPEMALPVEGKKKSLTKRHWLGFAGQCDVDRREALAVADELVRATPDARALVLRSYVAAPLRDQLVAHLERRAAELAEWAR